MWFCLRFQVLNIDILHVYYLLYMDSLRLAQTLCDKLKVRKYVYLMLCIKCIAIKKY